MLNQKSNWIELKRYLNGKDGQIESNRTLYDVVWKLQNIPVLDILLLNKVSIGRLIYIGF